MPCVPVALPRHSHPRGKTHRKDESDTHFALGKGVWGEGAVLGVIAEGGVIAWLRWMMTWRSGQGVEAKGGTWVRGCVDAWVRGHKGAGAQVAIVKQYTSGDRLHYADVLLS